MWIDHRLTSISAHGLFPWVTAVLLVIAAPRARAGDAQSPVLPPTAARPLQQAIELDGAKLARRYVLQEIRIDGTEAVVRFGRKTDGESVLGVTLKHPSRSEGALATVGAFSVHGKPGPVDLEALRALTQRLEGLAGDTMWVTPVVATKEAAPRPREDTPRVQAARDGVRLALHALRIDDGEDAVRRLEALEGDDGLRTAAGLELAEAWWRAGQGERGTKAAKRWRGEAGESVPAPARLRAQVLAGEELTTAQLTTALGEGTDPCAGDRVAQALDAVGRRPDGHALIGALYAQRACLSAGLQQVSWWVREHRFAEADVLSKDLVERNPESDEAVGRRAQVLMALARPVEAVALLEPVAWKDPESGLLSSLLGAYNRVEDETWQQQKRAELVARADGDPHDHVAAFFAGVLLHYGGQFEASTRRLEPLLTSLDKQPRLFIYLGMNAFNLDRPAEGLALIERARSLEAPDPDVYYCRAEILRWSDPPAAHGDLTRYLAQTRGSPTSNARKRARVQEMADGLAACIEKGGPIPCPGPWEHPYGHPANQPATDPDAPSLEPWLGAAAALIALVLACLVWRRRRAA